MNDVGAKTGYAQTLRSSAVMGGSQFINMMFAVARTKIVAILIGPSGVGLLAMFQSITALASTTAGLGIQQSGVRDIASAVGKGDHSKQGKVIVTLQRVCWLTGSVGMLTLVLFAPQINRFTFSPVDHTNAIRMLGLTILFGNIAAGQAAIIQGKRRIGDIARIAIISSIASTVAAGGFYSTMGLEGIVPTLMAISLVSLLTSTWFARRVETPTITTTWRESAAIAHGLITFGLALTWAGVVAALVGFGIKYVLAHSLDLVSVGIYSAAFSISGLFIKFVLQAMGTDYYPRLTEIAHDKEQMVRMINQQTEIGLLLAFPGLVATISFAPILIRLLYSKEFAPASDLLIWFTLGCMVRVISWPMGFAMLAMGKGKLYAAVQTIFQVSHLVLIYLFVQWCSLAGAAIAFLALYCVHAPAVFIICNRLIGFQYENSTTKLVVRSLVSVVVVLFISWRFPPATTAVLGCLISIASGIYCIRQLIERVGIEHRFARALYRIPGGEILLRGI